MRDPLDKFFDPIRATDVESNEGGGVFRMPSKTEDGNILIIISNGDGWDHVSASLESRCPTWQEMEAVKRAFFFPNEICYQLHVEESDHINRMPFCLHIWRPQNQEIPLPPKYMV